MAMRNDFTPNLDVFGHLWLAVLALAVEDASMDLEQIPPCIPPRSVRTYTENQWFQRRARIWINSTVKDVGSLEWICVMLNLDPEAIREEVNRRLAVRSDGDMGRGTAHRAGVQRPTIREASDANGSSTDTTPS
jgi:hypothetical protein